MSASVLEVTRNDPDDPLKQCNVRLPESLIETLDTRRKDLGISRDVWVERAIRFALSARLPAIPQTRSGRSLRRIR